MKIEDALGFIRRSARMIAGGDSYIEYDDLVQQSCLRFLTYAPNLDGNRNPEGYIYRIVKNVAHDMREQAKAERESHYILPSQARMLLDSRWNDKLVRGVILALPESDQKVLASRYVDGISPKRSSAERKRLDRAVIKFTAELNRIAGHGEFVGSRKVLSNSACRAVIDNQEGSGNNIWK